MRKVRENANIKKDRKGQKRTENATIKKGGKLLVKTWGLQRAETGDFGGPKKSR